MGQGRQQTLGLLDTLFARPHNKKKLLKEFQSRFTDNPYGFWRDMVELRLIRTPKVEAGILATVGMANATPDDVVLLMDRLTLGRPVLRRVRLRPKLKKGK